MTERREFVLGNGEKYFVRLPTVSESQEGDWVYSRIFNKAIENGIPPQQLMLKRLMEQGIWTEGDEQQLSNLRVSLDERLGELEDLLQEENGNEKAIDRCRQAILDIRAAIFTQQQKLMALLSHTAENKAYDARNFAIVAIVTEKENGERVWANNAAFEKERNYELIQTACFQYMALAAGLTEDETKAAFESK